MIIGTPKEVKEGETRVAMTPAWTKRLTGAGHEVLIQRGAGVCSGFSDQDYADAGARLVQDIRDIYQNARFIAKVKELKPLEYDLIQKDQMLMTWFHMAEDYEQAMTRALLDRQTIALSMELIVLDDGSRPTMKPMSDIAGSLAMLEAAKYCQTCNGGSGLLLRKIYGLPVPKIVILGGGNAGFNAAQVAAGLGLRVTVIEASWQRIDYFKHALPEADVVLYEESVVESLLTDCDIFINSIYVKPDKKRKPLISRELVREMKRCSLIMDIVGADVIETAHYTSISDPVYVEEGVRHYNVPNMPSLCPRTATEALLMITGPYIMSVADKGLRKAAEDDMAIRRCISTLKGRIVHPEVALNQDMEADYRELDLSLLP
ncbi:MAG: alanine dehydrogenase [Clostridiales Family XIII bacterium]|jgi:alanine dehydrogenase|nr:alanine dehydrogenase [Clostridiales Family XIII bacterium]